jgi:4'-phosphopantetheinyl transferase
LKSTPTVRPYVAEPESYRDLVFNVSRTHGRVVCLVAWRRQIGVDVEDASRSIETTEIAERFFSTAEIRDLRALPPSQQRIRFFAYWTLKESYVKARGVGLSIPLEKFSFNITQRDSIRVRLDASLQDDPHSWQFWPVTLGNRHPVAVAIFRKNETDLKIQVREVIPPAG